VRFEDFLNVSQSCMSNTSQQIYVEKSENFEWLVKVKMFCPTILCVTITTTHNQLVYCCRCLYGIGTLKGTSSKNSDSNKNLTSKFVGNDKIYKC
jgi:hypothetical protein